MKKRTYAIAAIAAALMLATSCSKDDDTQNAAAPASPDPEVQPQKTETISVPFSVTVTQSNNTLTKAAIKDAGEDGISQYFIKGDELVITGDGLSKINESVLKLVEESINDDDPATATFSGSLVFEKKRESLAKTRALPNFTATLRNTGQENSNPGVPLSQAVVSSGDMSLEQMFAHHGYLTADFEYEEGETPEIKLRQNTVVLKFDLGYTGAKVSVQLPGAEDYTEYTLGNNTTYMAVPDGSTVKSQIIDKGTPWSINLASEYSSNGSATVLYEIERETPENCVPGLFSVSADKQVFFSKGNLQYNATPQEGESQWCFAPTQYSICHTNGDDVGKGYSNWKEDDKYKWTDLFGWGMWLVGETPLNTVTDYTKYLTSITTTFTTASAIGSDWTTFTNEELCYLFSYESTSLGNFTNDTREGKYGWGSIELSEREIVNGMILLPDGWTTKPEGVETENNNYSIDEWELMEKAGAVFLPAAGSRFGTVVSGVGGIGYYWSSSAYGSERALYLDFGSSSVRPGRNDSRSYGQSVRLVRLAQ